MVKSNFASKQRSCLAVTPSIPHKAVKLLIPSTQVMTVVIDIVIYVYICYQLSIRNKCQKNKIIYNKNINFNTLSSKVTLSMMQVLGDSVFWPKRKIPYDSLNQLLGGASYKPDFCIMFCSLHKLHLHGMQIYENLIHCMCKE